MSFPYEIANGYLSIPVPEHLVLDVKLRIFHAMRNAFSTWKSPNVELEKVKRLMRVYEDLDRQKSLFRLSVEDVILLNDEMDAQHTWFHQAVANSHGRVKSNREEFQRREEIARMLLETQDS